MLQAQIDIAIKAREAAEAEKLEKETRALEVLALAQASFEKVEQDSKELEAEAEACTKVTVLTRIRIIPILDFGICLLY